MATIKIMSAGAVQAMITEVGAEFERASGHKLDLHFGTAGSLRERIIDGEQTDLIVLPPASIAAFVKECRLVPDSVIDLGRTVTGVVIKEGAPAPDITTPEAFKQALLAARSVSYTDPKAGGSSGTFFAGLLNRLGIAEAVAKKAVLGRRGYEVAQMVADGRAEIGTTFISEILTVKGARALGPLPGNLHNANTYTAAILAGSQANDAARAFLGALTNPDTRERWTKAGLEPAFTTG